MRVTSRDILAGPIAPVLRRMTAPMVIGILATMLFQAVDTYFVSLLGTAELAAISFTFPVTFMVINLAIGLGIGMSVTVGKAIGQGRHGKAARTTTETLMLSVLIMGVLTAIGLVTIDPLFAALGASAATRVLIHEYLDIWYLFATLLVLPMLCNSAIRATGDTKWPSILMMGSGLVNVVLDPILIFGWGPIPAMGIAGAAWATVGAWAVACVAAFYLLVHRERLLALSLPPRGELLRVWREVLVLAMPISLANMLGPVAIGALTAIVARHGEHAVAALGVGGRIEAFSLVVAFAITAALSPYMAQNLGAGQALRADRALRLCVRFVIGFQLAVYAVLAILAGPLAGLFSRDPTVVDTVVLYLRVMPLGIVCYAVIIVLNTAFNAHHRSGKTLRLSLLRVVAFVVPLAWFGSRAYGVPGVFVGAVAGNAAAALAALWTYRRMHAASDAPLAS